MNGITDSAVKIYVKIAQVMKPAKQPSTDLLGRIFFVPYRNPAIEEIGSAKIKIKLLKEQLVDEKMSTQPQRLEHKMVVHSPYFFHNLS